MIESLKNEADNLLAIIQKLIIKRREATNIEQKQINNKLTKLYDIYYLRLQQLYNNTTK